MKKMGAFGVILVIVVIVAVYFALRIPGQGAGGKASSGGSETEVAAMMAAMRAGTYAEEYNVYDFPPLAKSDIPELLRHAGNANVVTSFPVNRISSMHMFSCTEGMIALWLIEGIRAGGGGRFPSPVPVCYDKSKSVPKDALFYAEADLDVVANAYLSWWARVKKDSRDISGQPTPLEDSSLSWFGGRIPSKEEQEIPNH